MSDEGRPWGLCAAYGCPLLGSFTSATLGTDRWYCICHFDKPPGANDAISQILRGDDFSPIVKSVTDIRENGCSFHENPNAFRMIKERLTRMGRTELLLGIVDAPAGMASPLVKNWLGRLERVLVDATISFGKREKPKATVIGPTHISGHMPYAD